MRILLTNVWLLGRSGTETVVRDLAINLGRRGHAVTVFALKLGEPADELRAAGLAVIDDLAGLTETPDVVLGSHNVPVVLALAQFPDTPAVWISQDWRHWYDAPPRLSRLSTFLAIDQPRRDFLARVTGLAPEGIALLPNGVDLARILPRPVPLPDSPRRLLAFTKTSAQLEMLRKVCAASGLEFAAIGRGPGLTVANPERELVQHDIVVATGRSAIEAMVAGCAVIVGDARGMAGMVTPENLDALRNLNFGSEAFTQELSDDAVTREIARYDRASAEAVARTMRELANFEHTLDALEQQMHGAIEGARRQRGWTSADCRALRQFVHQWPAAGQSAEWQFRREQERLQVLRVGLDRQFSGLPRWFLAARSVWRRVIN